jgi:hypothetical protein
MAAKSSIAGVLIGRAGPSWRYMRLGFFHGWRTVRGVPAIRGERLERIGAFAGFDELIDRNLDLGPTTWRQSGYWTEIRQLRYGWCRRRRRRGPPPAIPGMPRNCRLSCCGTKGSNPSPSSEGSYKLDHRLELSRSASKQPKACPPRQPPNLFEFQQACFVPQAFCDPNATKGNPGAHYDTSIALDLHFSETPPNKCPGPMQ